MNKELTDEEIMEEEINNISNDPAFKSEMDIIKKYKLSDNANKYIEKYYLDNVEISYENNNISKILNLLVKVLSSHDMSSKEIRNYINKNHKILESTYTDFAIRLALFDRTGYLDELLFKDNDLLNINSIKKNISNRELLYLLQNFNFNVEYDKLINLVKTSREDRPIFKNNTGYGDFYVMKSIFNSFKNKLKHNNIRVLK